MRCKFTKPNGDQCEANAMKDSVLCFTHNPAVAEKKKAAVSKGGKSPRRNHQPIGAIEINNTKDIVGLIIQTINEVREGTIEVRVANCIFYGTGHLIKAFEIIDLDERITRLEEKATYMHKKSF